jgi:hypothetical protein
MRDSFRRSLLLLFDPCNEIGVMSIFSSLARFFSREPPFFLVPEQTTAGTDAVIALSAVLRLPSYQDDLVHSLLDEFRAKARTRTGTTHLFVVVLGPCDPARFVADWNSCVAADATLVSLMSTLTVAELSCNDARGESQQRSSLLRPSAEQTEVEVPDAEEIFGTTLSTEADEFLTACNRGFNEKQAELSDTWLRGHDGYDADLDRGLLWIRRKRSIAVEFDVCCIGSARLSTQTWEWAWNNPNVEQRLALPRSLFVPTAAEYGLKYLESGMVPMPDAEFGWYVSGIALRLAGGEGVYRAEAKDYEIYLLLKNPRSVTRS